MKPDHRRLSERFIRAAVGLGFNSIVTTVLTSLASIAVARAGGPDAYATFVAANMVIFVPTIVAMFGLPLALAKQVAEDEQHGRHPILREKTSSAIVGASCIALLVGVGLALGLNPIGRVFEIEFGGGFALVLPAVLVLSVIADISQGIYSGLLRPAAVTLIAVSGPLCMLAYVLVWRTNSDLPLWGAVAMTYGVSGLVAAAFLLKDALLTVRVGLSSLRHLGPDLFPAATYTYFTTFSTWADRAVVGLLLGPASMGWYTSAAVIVQVALRLPTHVAYLLIPTSARLGDAHHRHDQLRNGAVESFGLFAVMAAVGMAVAPTALITLVFGQGFAPGADALLIMAPSLIAAAITVPFLSTLTGSESNRMIVGFLGVATIGRISLLLVCTALWDLAGTAFATVASDWLMASVCIALGPKLGHPISGKPLGKPLLFGLLALAAGLGLSWLGVPVLLAAAVASGSLLPAVFHMARRLRVMAVSDGLAEKAWLDAADEGPLA